MYSQAFSKCISAEISVLVDIGLNSIHGIKSNIHVYVDENKVKF